MTQPRRGAARDAGWWYGPMAAGGLAFGLLGDRRPFGTDVLGHPLVVFFVIAGAALLALRIALKRPVPEVLSERTLMAGCVLGAGAFLAGNWIAGQFLR